MNMCMHVAFAFSPPAGLFPLPRGNRPWEEMKKADSTRRSSQAVPHPSTNRALRRLTSEVGRDPVHSTRYGRQRYPHSSWRSTMSMTWNNSEIISNPQCNNNKCWAEAPIKIARMTLTIKLDRNWSSFQLANNTPPLSVTGSVIAPSARIVKAFCGQCLRMLCGNGHVFALQPSVLISQAAVLAIIISAIAIYAIVAV